LRKRVFGRLNMLSPDGKSERRKGLVGDRC
jgi:hypothetical protein